MSIVSVIVECRITCCTVLGCPTLKLTDGEPTSGGAGNASNTGCSDLWAQNECDFLPAGGNRVPARQSVSSQGATGQPRSKRPDNRACGRRLASIVNRLRAADCFPAELYNSPETDRMY